MIQPYDLPCTSCNSQLMEVGLFLQTDKEFFICCDVCRALYYIDMMECKDGRPLILLQPTNLDPDEEFYIISHAISMTPLRDQLLKDNKVEEDLKSKIDSSVTPSDLIRKLHNE